jgi:hypothetical protein
MEWASAGVREESQSRVSDEDTCADQSQTIDTDQ